MLYIQLFNTYINRIQSWYGESVLNNLGLGSKCYNVIILTFWTPSWISDSLSVWQNLYTYLGTDKYGKSTAMVQKYLLDELHKQNKKLFISAFGSTSNPTNLDPETVASQLADFINQNPYLDGVDIDYEDNDAMRKGTAVNWLIVFQKALSSKVQNKNIIFTHAPQAPYFSRQVYNDQGYYKIEKEIGHLISWYNVQFYNQLENKYDTYETLFLESGEFFVQSSYKEIIELAEIPIQKLILGKPAVPNDASNTGYITPDQLGQICNKAKGELGYELPGFMIWQFLSDNQCNFHNQFINNYQP
ncbi:hypothetical protein IMG5_054750 [Ichthyophthirius multifiliis]|uniref:chitinase n=1 Tax=Ichthyophthirius multifiliis TaxID=5932 RepID=G0QN22_ICHMU|nr:hypothetical protein IMG5_054750 [Ichthyophthirius multifiliis]EGR33385.1 hypothetical protein IMG5_054750 [Ichthyophthirius multifiliis]|eukprot:XP_004037371.1 hypothetical protein IMG5_054750 [Ichthyophthirius multifiliis]